MNITLSHITFAFALIGCALGILGYIKKQYVPSEIVDLKEELGALKSEVSVLQKQVGLFWGLVEKNMSQMLHSPHRPNLDALLDKNLSGVGLTQSEAVQLVTLLQKLIDGRKLAENEITWAMLLMAATVAKYRLEN